jgi:ABC-2 type transport system permease protein
MAVYKKTYRPWEGTLTPLWRRWLVIPFYAFEDLRRRRFFSLFFLATFLYPLICALIVWVSHDASLLRLFNVENAQRLISINDSFFLNLLGWQSMMGLFLAAFVGPGLVSPDLANNGLALYLARPFSRAEYVLGKAGVLAILLSLTTWIPALLVFALQGYLEGWNWVMANARIGTGLFIGAWVWIVLLALLALSLSAWVKWKPAAGALMFGIFFVAAGFGVTINQVQHTSWGHLLNISELMGEIWVSLTCGAASESTGGVFFRVIRGQELPLWACWAAIGALCLLCLWVLAKKIRGTEVVR